MKLFAAIMLPSRLTGDIARVQRGVTGARWTPEEKLHVTTAFFGEVDEERAEQLDRELAARPLPSFDLQLEGAGHFGRERARSLWLGVAPNPALERLHAHCKAAAGRAGLTLEKRRYKPHVTLAYLSSTTPPERVVAFEKRASRFNCKPYLIDEYFLFSSHAKKTGGNLYRKEASYPLLGRSL